MSKTFTSRLVALPTGASQVPPRSRKPTSLSWKKGLMVSLVLLHSPRPLCSGQFTEASHSVYCHGLWSFNTPTGSLLKELKDSPFLMIRALPTERSELNSMLLKTSFLRKLRRIKRSSRNTWASLSSRTKFTELQRCSTTRYLRRSKRSVREQTWANTTSLAGTLWQHSSSKTSTISSRQQICSLSSSSKCLRGQQLYGNRETLPHQTWHTSSSKLLPSEWIAKFFKSQLGLPLRACRVAKMYNKWSL